MSASRPSFRENLAIVEHDALHGQRRPPLGSRARWLRMWWIKNCRQWTRVDALVCGSNPILGAMACAGMAKAGKSVLWLSGGGFDAWDYPLALSGQHDDLMLAAGLPPMGRAWFVAMASLCSGRVTRAPGWEMQYVFQSARAEADPIGFAARAARGPGAKALGASRTQAQEWMEQAFAGGALHEPKLAPARHGGAERQQLFSAKTIVWVADQPDGVAREMSLDAGRVAGSEIRLGRARWHAQVPLEFAAQSRLDLKLALAAGWGGDGR